MHTHASCKRIAVAVMAKAPIPGTVKTRLSPPLTPETAAALARCCLLDTLAHVRGVPGICPVLAFAPETAAATFEALAPDFLRVPQQGDDLGQRLLAVLGRLCRNHPAGLVIGSDLPTLPSAILEDATRLVTDRAVDVVLGPSDDGGYYLIGSRRAHPELLVDMPWSTAQVVEETCRRAATYGLRLASLPPWFDVDTPGDLERLRGELQRHPAMAPHTARFLAAVRL